MSDRELLARLRALQADGSKHGSYQSLPSFVAEALGGDLDIDRSWRGDHHRLAWLERVVDTPPRRVVDIGANTGFFLLSACHRWGVPGVAYEPNPNHGDVVRAVAAAFDLEVRVETRGVDLAGAGAVTEPGDLVILLNVLHHAGVEYDTDEVSAPTDVPAYATRYLERLRAPGARLLLQLGYRWGGALDAPIVEVDEVDRFVALNVAIAEDAGWQVDRVAVPEPDGDLHVMRDVSVDAARSGLGWSVPPGTREFNRRPLLLARVPDADG